MKGSNASLIWVGGRSSRSETGAEGLWEAGNGSEWEWELEMVR
jgi:hypothetical protein